MFAPDDITDVQTDVLILGAGLAGLRAAWAARQAAPDQKVLVIGSRRGPGGASFANVHNELGMLVCRDADEEQALVRDALALAAPGWMDPALVRLLAGESRDRFDELTGIGFQLKTGPAGKVLRHPGCFRQGMPLAYVFADMTAAFYAMRAHVLEQGAGLQGGLTVLDLIRAGPHGNAPVVGACLITAGGRCVAVRAKAVVMALGGSATLFALNVAGGGTSGYPLALLHRAGAELVNAAYLQFLWNGPDRRFWPIQYLGRPGYRIRTADGRRHRVPEPVRVLAGERGLHGPAAYGRDDTALDRFVLDHLNPDGWVTIDAPRNRRVRIGLMAHAGNGGARIDTDGATRTAGLFACGECAGGMHGANRIGGAMVAATQVFGARAGAAAAHRAARDSLIRADHFREQLRRQTASLTTDLTERRLETAWLQAAMQRHALHGGGPGLPLFLDSCREKQTTVKDWRLKLLLESAMLICQAARQ